MVENARDNLIGGSSIYGYGNVISGNGSEQPNSGFGVFIGAVLPSPASDSLPSGNKVQGNRIGLKKTLNEALGNTTAVQLAHARDNVIGGDS
ncbi:MAG: hypothetical protein IPJ30_05145 [Acidobacteria bacterium]|nr:hypothetical protein [Acidobacteriota bacterium]